MKNSLFFVCLLCVFTLLSIDLKEDEYAWPPLKKLTEKHWLGGIPGVEIFYVNSAEVKSKEAGYVTLTLNESRKTLEKDFEEGPKMALVINDTTGLSKGDKIKAIFFAVKLKVSKSQDSFISQSFSSWKEKAMEQGVEYVVLSSAELNGKNITNAEKIKAEKNPTLFLASLAYFGTFLFGAIAAFSWIFCKRQPRQAFLKFTFSISTLGWGVFTAYLGLRPDAMPTTLDLLSIFPIAMVSVMAAFWSLNQRATWTSKEKNAL